MRALLAGIAIALAAAGCAEDPPVDGTLLVVSGSEFSGLTPDEAKAAAHVVERRLQAAGVERARVSRYAVSKFEVFLPSTDPAMVGDWRLLVTTPGVLQFRPIAPAKVVDAASASQPPDGYEWLRQRGGSKRRLVKLPVGAAFPEGAVVGASASPGVTGLREIVLTFGAASHDAVERYTTTLVGRTLAIVMDGEVLIAPTLKEPLRESAVISGQFSQVEAARLAALAAVGPLPAPLKIDGATPVTR